MVPRRFGFLPRLPTTVGGKIDRHALSELETPESAEADTRRMPRTELETLIAAQFRAVLGLRCEPSIEADFFLELGGDSLTAAMLISNLRGNSHTAALTVRDLYEARTVTGLAVCARTSADEEERYKEELTSPRGNPILAGMVQGAWLFAGLFFGATVAYWAGFYLLPWLLRFIGLVPFLLLGPFFAAAALLFYSPLAVYLAALLKKLLIGRYEPERVPMWGSFYLRNWMVQQVVQIIPWNLLQGTVFTSWALRVLGAKIGRRVHIHRGVNLQQGGWDLLTIGDDVSLCQDSSVRLVDLVDEHLIVGPVTIGAGEHNRRTRRAERAL
jgi:hypothetical protein